MHCNRWFRDGVIKATDDSRRGAGSDKYGTDRHILKREHLQSIIQYIDTNNVRLGGMVSVRLIRAHLLREFDRAYNKSTLYYALKV